MVDRRMPTATAGRGRLPEMMEEEADMQEIAEGRLSNAYQKRAVGKSGVGEGINCTF